MFGWLVSAVKAVVALVLDVCKTIADKIFGSGSVGSPDAGLSAAGADAGTTCGDGGVGDASHCPPCSPIASIKIVSLKFLSDHGLLKDYNTDWNDGGSPFPKPEWTTANQYPVSHTMDKPVEVEVEIEIDPPNACAETGTLHGDGPGGMVFEKSGVSFSPGKSKITVTSDRNLEKKIQELNFSVNWSTRGTSVSIAPSQTANRMYVTMGTPVTPRWPGVTLKRMKHAVSATGAANSLDPHQIVKHVLSKWSSFNLSQVYDNEWELADDATDAAGNLIGADCQTIVRHTESVIRMVGCPGKSEFIVVWAKVPAPAVGVENPAYIPNVVNPPQRYNSFRPPNPAKATWLAGLVDGSGGLNKYEACLRFTYPEGSPAASAKKYYAGGVGVFISPNQVIRVFTTMSWIDGATLTIKGTIFTY
jgi:hypothetical protein